MGLKASQRHARVPLLLEMASSSIGKRKASRVGNKFESKTSSYETETTIDLLGWA